MGQDHSTTRRSEVHDDLLSDIFAETLLDLVAKRKVLKEMLVLHFYLSNALTSVLIRSVRCYRRVLNVC